MTSVNIVDRPSSSKNRAPKKFAKKKGGRTTKVENKVRKSRARPLEEKLPKVSRGAESKERPR